MSANFDRSAIMKAAHFMARWRVQSVGGFYREWFAKALSSEWFRPHRRIVRGLIDKGRLTSGRGSYAASPLPA